LVLICISFMARDVEHFFMCFFFLIHFHFFLWKSSQFFCPFLHLVIDFGGKLSFLSSLYILVVNPLSDV
jgi:hypothetical protein